jgi:hypothetical protein
MASSCIGTGYILRTYKIPDSKASGYSIQKIYPQRVFVLGDVFHVYAQELADVAFGTNPVLLPVAGAKIFLR